MPEIDGIYIKIAGDITQLRADMTRARAIVKESATGISNVLNNALSPKQVQQGLNSLIRDLGTLQRASKLTGNELKHVVVDLKEVQHVTGLTDREFQKLQRRMLNTRAAKAQADALKRIARDADLSRLATAKLNLQMGNIGGAARALTPSLASVRSAFLGIGIAAGTLGYLSKQLYDAAAAGESLNVSFKSIFGSAEAAAEQMGWLRGLAKDLGQNYWVLADAYKGVAAASRDTILEGKETQRIFKSITMASTALGLTADQTKGALNAIAQMMSKGKISAEELRQQLGERLYGAFQLAAQAAGVTTQQLDKMLQQGDVSIGTLIKLAGVIENKYGKAALEASTKGRASMNRFSEAATDFATNLGTTLKPALDEILNLSTKALNSVNALMRPRGLNAEALQSTMAMLNEHMAKMQATLKETPPGTDAYDSLIKALAEGERTANKLEIKLRELQRQQESSAQTARQLKADMEWGQSFTVSLQARIDGERKAEAEIAALRGDSTQKELLRIEKEKQARIKAGMSAYDAEQVAIAEREKLYADQAEKRQKELDKMVKEVEAAFEKERKAAEKLGKEKLAEDKKYFEARAKLAKEHADFLLELEELEAKNSRNTQKLKELELERFLKKKREMLKDGAITQEEFDRIAAAKRVEINKTSLQKMLEDWQDFSSGWEDIAKNFLENLQSEFASTFKRVFEGAEDAWDGMWESFKNIAYQAIAAVAAKLASGLLANIVLNIMPSMSGILGGGGGLNLPSLGGGFNLSSFGGSGLGIGDWLTEFFGGQTAAGDWAGITADIEGAAAGGFNWGGAAGGAAGALLASMLGPMLFKQGQYSGLGGGLGSAAGMLIASGLSFTGPIGMGIGALLGGLGGNFLGGLFGGDDDSADREADARRFQELAEKLAAGKGDKGTYMDAILAGISSDNRVSGAAMEQVYALSKAQGLLDWWTPDPGQLGVEERRNYTDEQWKRFQIYGGTEQDQSGSMDFFQLFGGGGKGEWGGADWSQVKDVMEGLSEDTIDKLGGSLGTIKDLATDWGLSVADLLGPLNDANLADDSWKEALDNLSAATLVQNAADAERAKGLDELTIASNAVGRSIQMMAGWNDMEADGKAELIKQLQKDASRRDELMQASERLQEVEEQLTGAHELSEEEVEALAQEYADLTEKLGLNDTAAADAASAAEEFARVMTEDVIPAIREALKLGGGGDKSHTGGYFMHSGGPVGRDYPELRFHSGGLLPDEIPVIAQRGEFMLSRDDVRRLGGAGGVEALRKSGGISFAPVINITATGGADLDGLKKIIAEVMTEQRVAFKRQMDQVSFNVRR